MAAVVENANDSAPAQQPVTADVVGKAFAQQYYHILHHSPGLAYRFYQDISTIGRQEEDGTMRVSTTMQAINEKIASLNYGDSKAVINSVDSQDSLNGGFQVLVTGYMLGQDNTVRNFAQAFFLAPQDTGYFVLNDVFRYLNNFDQDPAMADSIVAPVTAELENHISEQSATFKEELAPEVQNPLENGGAPIPIAEEIPVAEVVDESPRDVHTVVKSSVKIEGPKKSYASIVKHLKESSATSSRPPVAPEKAPAKIAKQPNHTPILEPEVPVSGSESVDLMNNQDSEEGYSIYIRGIPNNASASLLADFFKKFGTIKKDGIQIRNNWQQGFYFGFVEFEDASSVQKAVEASPVTIGGRQVIVEEKRSTVRGGYRGSRFQSQRGGGFRNDGNRGGRGNFNGGANNVRGGFNGGRGSFNGGNRGFGGGGVISSSNTGEYRANRTSTTTTTGGGGIAKNFPSRVSATA